MNVFQSIPAMHPVRRTALADTYAEIRRAALDLAAPLSAEDCQVQSMPDASPTKWHLAHTTWFFETFLLEPHEPDFKPFDPGFRVLFNSYYQYCCHLMALRPCFSKRCGVWHCLQKRRT